MTTSHTQAHLLSRPAATRRGMTLFELVLSLVLVASLLGGAVKVSGLLRDDNADSRTRDVLRSLRRAMQAYHAHHGDWPAGPTHDALASMIADPAVKTMLADADPQRDTRGQWFVHDGYGRPVHYLPPTASIAASPDFVSAGRDGVLGDLTGPRSDRDVTDNLYGSELEGAAAFAQPEITLP